MLMDCNGNALSLSLCDESKTAEKRTRVRKLTMHWRQGERQQKAQTLTLVRFSFISVCVFPAHIRDLKTVEMGKCIDGRNKSSSLGCLLLDNRTPDQCGASKSWCALVSLMSFFLSVFVCSIGVFLGRSCFVSSCDICGNIKHLVCSMQTRFI